MFKAISIVNKKSFYSFYNITIHFLQKIPFIGNFIKNKAYNIKGFDFFINPISFIFSFISSIFKKYLFYGLGIYFLVYNVFIDFIDDIGFEDIISEIGKNNIYIYFLASFTIIGTLMYLLHFYQNNTLETYLFVKQMKIKPRDYYLGTFFYNAFIFILSFTIVIKFIFITLSIDISLLNILSYIIFLYSLRFLFAQIMLSFNIRNEKIINIISYIQWGFIVLLFIIFVAYIPLTKTIIDFRILFDYKFGILGVLIFIYSSFILIKNNNIDNIAYDTLNYSKLTSVKVDEIRTVEVRVNKDKLIKGNKDFSNYNGIEYVNKIFFDRTKNLLHGKRIRGYLLRAASFIAIAVLSFFVREGAVKDLEAIKFFKNYMNIIIFVLCYFIFSGDFFIKYCFYNMDSSLMQNNFLRRKDLLMKSMKIRTIQLLKYYLLPFIIYLVSISIVTINFNLGINQLILNILFATLGWLVFTMHYLFAYYIIQPFSKQMEVKNPLYTMLTHVIYMGGYFAVMSGVNGQLLSIIFFIFSILYLILGVLGLIYIAPKRFKLR